MQKTAKQFLEYSKAAELWIGKNPKLSKFKRAIERFGDTYAEAYKPIKDLYNKKRKEIEADIKDLQIDYADKDANGNIICFTETETTATGSVIIRETAAIKCSKPENMKLLERAVRAKSDELHQYDLDLLNNEIEFEPYYATELPEDLEEYEIKAMSGFVINPEMVTGQSE